MKRGVTCDAVRGFLRKNTIAVSLKHFQEEPSPKRTRRILGMYKETTSSQDSTRSDSSYRCSQQSEADAHVPVSEEENIVIADGTCQRSSTIEGAMKTLESLLAITNIHKTDDFNTLGEQTKERRSRAFRKLVERIASHYAEQGTDGLLKYAFQQYSIQPTLWTKLNSKLAQVATAIGEMFNTARTATQRIEILALITPNMRYSEVAQYVPGLTHYFYRKSRRYSITKKAGIPIDVVSTIKVRYDAEKVDSFLDFIVSPLIAEELPYGQVDLKTSDGTVITVPNVVRKLPPTRIIDSYKSFLDEQGESNLALSDSTYIRILKTCKAETLNRVAGVDYFAM